MNRQKSWLIAAIAALILTSPLAVGLELSGPDASLIDKHNLAGIKKLSVYVLPTFAEPDGITFDRTKLERKVEQKLKDAGIDVVAATSIGPGVRPAGNIPELRIYIAALKIDPQKYVFYIDTSVATMVNLPTLPGRSFMAGIWRARPVMTIIGPDTIADSLEKAVSPQVDEFILAYHAANRENPAPEKTPAAADTEKRISRRAQRSQQVSYKFVASKNSKVFHKPDCPFAKRIKPENLVTFKSRSEAVQAGKRPCKRCNP